MSYAYEIRDRDIGGILDQAVFLFRDHFKYIALVTVLLIVPLMGVADFLTQLVTPDPAMVNPDTGMPENMSGQVLASLWTMILVTFVGAGVLFLVCVSYADAVIVHGMTHRCLGAPVPLKASMRVAWRVLPRMILLQIATIGIVFMGSFLCVVPGLILMALFFLAPTVLVLEQTSITGAMSRSAYLVRGAVWRVIALILVVNVMSIGVLGAVEVIPAAPVYHVLYVLGESAFTAFEALVAVVLYLAARCRVEHLDLDLLANEVDAMPAPGEVLL